MRPEVLGPGDRYLSFKRAELAVPEGMGECQVHDSGIDPSSFDSISPAPVTQTGVMHRVYRTSMSSDVGLRVKASQVNLVEGARIVSKGWITFGPHED